MKKVLFAFGTGGTLGVLGTLFGLLYAFVMFLSKCEPARVATQDLISDVTTETIERVLYGDSPRRRRRTPYNRYAKPQPFRSES